MLKSKLLSPSQRLKSCEVQDAAHVTRGDSGDHVKRIQQALIRIDNAKIEASDLENAKYGDSTAAAVLSYKSARTIINKSYQKTADDIVGKMTIKRLDDDMLALELGMSDDFFAASLRPLHGRLT